MESCPKNRVFSFLLKDSDHASKVLYRDTYLWPLNLFFSKKIVTNFEKNVQFRGSYVNFSKTKQKITNPPMVSPPEFFHYHINSHIQK